MIFEPRMTFITDMIIGMLLPILIFVAYTEGFTWYVGIFSTIFILHTIRRWFETASVIPPWARTILRRWKRNS